MGTHLRLLGESYPMNTNMTGFRWLSKIFASLCFGQKQLQHWKGYRSLVRAVPFKSVGGRRNVRFFEGGRGRILN